MRDELLEYYQTELNYLRTMGEAFAQRYPKIADRLQLDPKHSTDPHVERLLQGFAFLAARVQLKIDDDFPEVSEGLLNAVYPHYLRPLPAMTIVQFVLDPEKGKLPTGYAVSAGRTLLSRLEVKGDDAAATRCTFRTCYDTTAWPLRIKSADWLSAGQLDLGRPAEAVAALRLKLECFTDASFSTLQLDSLRLYLDGADHLPYTLYELLTNNCLRIVVRDTARRSTTSSFPPARFAPLDSPSRKACCRSFAARSSATVFYRSTSRSRENSSSWTLEASTYSARAGSARKRRCTSSSPRSSGEAHGAFRSRRARGHVSSRLHAGGQSVRGSERAVQADQRARLPPDCRRLSSARHAHLFRRLGRHSLPQRVDCRRASVFTRSHGNGAESLLDCAAPASVSRRESDGVPETASSNGDYQGPSELWLSFIDLTGRVVQPDADSFDANVTCFNGDLPNRLPIGTGGGASQRSDFDLPGGGPFQAVVAISSPSPASQPPLGRAQLWRLISFLSLNYISLTDAGLGPLKALLRLHNTHDSPAWSGRDHIDGIVGIQSAAQYARVAGEYGTGFARGLRVEVEFDEDRFEGASAYLFASVLERFFGLYNSINSFSVLAARSRQRRNLLREWAPRSGWRSPL